MDRHQRNSIRHAFGPKKICGEVTKNRTKSPWPVSFFGHAERSRGTAADRRNRLTRLEASTSITRPPNGPVTVI